MSETIVWLGAGVVMLAAQFMGYRLGASGIAEDVRPGPRALALVLANFGCVYVAVGGAALLVSSMSSRRGIAIAIVFGALLASFLINFLAQFWEPAKHLAFLSVLNYYQPAQIIATGEFPWRSALTLLGFGAACGVIACEMTARRSVCTT